MADLSSLLPGISPLINQFLNQGSQNAATNAASAGLNAFNGLTLPQIQQLLYTAAQTQAAGPYAAAQAGSAQIGSNALANINLNPQAQQAELTTLGQLQGIAANNGLTPQTQAQLMAARNQYLQTAQGQNASILQHAQQQGLGNSGIGIMAELANNQGNENALANAAYQAQAAQQAQQQAALQGAGALGGQIYGQQYNQALNQAQAQNAINAANAGFAQQSGLANQQATNQALQQAVANQQTTNLANQGALNTASQQNAQNTLLQGQQQLNQATGISNAGNNLGSFQQNLNQINQSATTPLLNTLFGSTGGTITKNGTTTTTPAQSGLLSNWFNSGTSSTPSYTSSGSDEIDDAIDNGEFDF